MRGEDAAWSLKRLTTMGSPPHARGRLASGENNRERLGITPACAGKTAPPRNLGAAEPDHPRMRGEDYFGLEVVDYRLGSPPHARGRLGRARPRMGALGITPACAGKTEVPSTWADASSDHPRMRGEDSGLRRWRSGSQGSPPHARGRPTRFAGRGAAGGITPACAGKTSNRAGKPSCQTDHPRMRGEDPRAVPLDCAGRGSPPHARGRLPRNPRLLLYRRITPACAGKTRGTGCR